MRNLRVNLLELIRRTSAELPDDVFRAVDVGTKAEETGTTGGYAMDIITKNIDLARRKSQPLCQDTGSILFFVKAPVGFDQVGFEVVAKAAVAEATAKGYLRQNSVNSVTGKNSGNNLGPGSPVLHFHQYHGTRLDVRLILKGGGCENVGAQYSLPDTTIGANRDLEGVRKAILNAVVLAQGKGCSPGNPGCLHRGGSGHRLSSLERAVPAHAGGCAPRSGAGRDGAGHRKERQHAGDRAHGVRRQDDAARVQDRLPESTAGELLRLCLVHVLGLPAPGIPAERGGEDRQVALLIGC